VAAMLVASVADLAVRIMIAGGLLLLAIIVLALGVWYYRRRWLGGTESSTTPWTLEDLRQLRAGGDITEAEYQALRGALIGQYVDSSKTDSGASPESPDGSDPQQPDLNLKEPPPA
jgi:hypothetical protein